MKHRLLAMIVLGCVAAAPARGLAQQPAATVTCKDGSTGKAGKGACSHHGGVDKGASSSTAATPAPAPAPAPHRPANDNAAPPPASTQRKAPAPSTRQPGQPTAKCKDGSMSYSAHHSGACSHHGGVGQWLDGSQ
jgi:hypothetical protein